MTVTETPPTMQDLADERGRVLAQIDDILNTATAEGRSDLTDEERTEHDALAERNLSLEGDIGRMSLVQQDQARFTANEARRAFNVPMVNIISTPSPTANRSLDELLWATEEDVPAGSFDKAGRFQQHFGARSTVEQVVVRNPEGDGTGVMAPRMGELRPEHRGAVRAFQKTVADMVLFGLLVDKDTKSSRQGFEVARSHRLMKPRWEAALRAMDTDTAAEGITWIPTGIGANLHEKVRAAGKIAPLFARIDIPTNPWKWPIEGADATAYRVAEPTGDTETKMTASTPGTVAATFDAEIFGARALFSKSLEADSAIAIMPYVQRKLVQAFIDAEEKAILDGDTDGTHQDSDIGASTTAAVTAWDGLRKRALANASLDGAAAALTPALLASTRALMGKWGLNPADLAFIVSVSSVYDIISDSSVLTVDKMGPLATILNGQLASVHGIPIIASEHMRENLNASGVYDGITTTRGYALCVNRQEWVMGQRMALDVEADDSIYRETYQRVVVGFQREDFQNIGDATTNDDTAIIYEVAP